MFMLTVFVERSGGAWEAKWWHTDEGRYFLFRSHDREDAVRRAVASTGYRRSEVKIVECT